MADAAGPSRSRARHLAAMRLALAERLPLSAAKQRLIELRQAERAARRGQQRCGTEITPEADGEESRFWWQRGDMA